MLYLFDIDCTLIKTTGAGISALTETSMALFQHEGPPLDLAGSTDKGIVMSVFDHFQKEHTEEAFQEYYQHYLKRLHHNLNSPDYEQGCILPGTLPLLESLQDQGHTLGLLTGNIAEGARVKLDHFALSYYFTFGAYGDDHHDRNKLGPIALQRAAEATGKNFTADDTIVIGDTPKDINCAHAFGAQCIAVATGNFSAEELAAYNPARVIESLEELL